MVILIIFLTLIGFVLLFEFIYVNISLFHWVYFTSFFDRYIEKKYVFIHLEAAIGRL